jgi:predicted dinucleotide-binding enzyme
MNIGIIGAGNVGGNLGVRLSKSGFDVRFGVKDPKGASDLLGRCSQSASAGTVEEAANADVIFLALPSDVAVELAKTHAKALEGKIIVDCNNTLKWKEGPVWDPPAEGSLAQAIAKAAPGAKVVKGFNTFGAEHHLDPKGATVFLAGDDAGAKKTVSEIASKAGFAPVDAGPLRNAGLLENVAILWIHLAMVGGKGRSFSIVLKQD